MNLENFYRLIENNYKGIIGALIGLFFALIFLIFGFWRGILIIVFVAIGFYIGNNWNRIDFYGLLNYILPPWR